MTNNNYMNAIHEAQALVTEILNDPDHGKLTFAGRNGLEDEIITSPRDLDELFPGSVLAISGVEWMALDSGFVEPRQWQHYGGRKRATNEELYLIALKTPNNLQYCHEGI